jgi:DNA-directed RNA polymerase subunit F
MIGKKIYEERVITSSEARELLEESMKKDQEPVYEKKITLDHLSKFAKLSAKEARSLVGELMRSNERLKEDVAVKIVDLMPKDETDVRAIFAKERYALTKEEIQGILRIIRGE